LNILPADRKIVANYSSDFLAALVHLTRSAEDQSARIYSREKQQTGAWRNIKNAASAAKKRNAQSHIFRKPRAPR
jgi:hypothetical protein